MATTAVCYSHKIFALQDIDLFSIIVSLTSHVNIAWMEHLLSNGHLLAVVAYICCLR